MTARSWPAIAAAIVIVALPFGARAAEQAVAPADISALLHDGGSSSREARRQAIAGMPLERIKEPHRRAIEQCLRSTTLYRHLPTETVSCDGDLLAFALHKPETIVDIWRVLGISRMSLDPAGARQWRLSDGYGTVGVLRLVHREQQGRAGTLVFHGRGAYTGPLSPKHLSGTCVLMVRHAPTAPATDGTERHTVQIDAFLDMDGMGLEIVTRTLHPLIVRSASANLHEICLFMQTLSEAAETNPDGIAHLAVRLARTDPEDRQTLVTIARSAAGKAAAGRVVAASVDPQRLQAELAARWLPAEDLDRLHK